MKKKLILCAAMVAIMMMASCCKDNDELIVGKWRIQSMEGIAASGQTISDVSGDVQTEEIVYVDSWGWVFNADGTGYSYEIKNGQENEMGQFTYTIDEETLHMPFGNFHIEKLNSRKLRLCDTVNIYDVEVTFIRYEYGYLNFKRR